MERIKITMAEYQELSSVLEEILAFNYGETAELLGTSEREKIEKIKRKALYFFEYGYFDIYSVPRELLGLIYEVLKLRLMRVRQWTYSSILPKGKIRDDMLKHVKSEIEFLVELLNKVKSVLDSGELPSMFSEESQKEQEYQEKPENRGKKNGAR